jgi:hypothetical protein
LKTLLIDFGRVAQVVRGIMGDSMNMNAHFPIVPRLFGSIFIIG